MDEIILRITQASADSMTSAAQWINSAFGGFDHAILQFYNNLHTGALGGLSDVFFKTFTLLGEDGIFLILTSLILIAFKKTRKAGCTMLFAVGFGAIFTNLTIKDAVARPRPYATTDEYFNWWYSVRNVVESEYSFPSGHTTASMAAMTAVFLNGKKKYSWTAFIFVIVMGASRNYLMVHYPSDIIGGMIVGACAAVISYILMTVLFDKVFKKNKLGAIITETAPVDKAVAKISKEDEAKTKKLTKAVIATGIVVIALASCILYSAKLKKEIVSDDVIQQAGYTQNSDGNWEFVK